VKVQEETYKEPLQQQNQRFDWKRFFSYEWVVHNIPFFLFLALLAVIYIYNGHYADKQERRINATEKHIKELEYEYKTIKSEVIFRSKASELLEAVEPLGLRALTITPYVLNDSTDKN
jgi:Bacteriodetes cell division protein (FtsL-like)